MMRLTPTEIEIANIIEHELTEMVDNILIKHKQNQINRRNNPFNCFENPYIKNYMGMGRSFDSQLGNRLQNIALHIVRLNKYKFAPNHFIFNLCENMLYISTVIDNSNKQFIGVGENINDEEYLRSFPISYEQKDYLLSLSELYKIKNKIIGIPVDLIYYDTEYNTFDAFEIKSGGNLDTKNADANFNEVLRLMKILNPINGSQSYFATCYNNMGEGANPQGSIFAKLPEDHILIGKDFWNKILPVNVSYKRFIEIYQYIFREVVQVDKSLQV